MRRGKGGGKGKRRTCVGDGGVRKARWRRLRKMLRKKEGRMGVNRNMRFRLCAAMSHERVEIDRESYGTTYVCHLVGGVHETE